MSHYTGPKCKLCRREQVKLFLKGAKCESEKCPVVVRQSLPGPHSKRRPKVTDYGRQLREKQKVKRIYGLNEAQSRAYFLSSLKDQRGGGVGEAYLSHLERRLDNVVYRLGLGWSRTEARQKIRHGQILVSGKVVTFPGYAVRPGDAIMVLRGKDLKVADRILPAWLKYSGAEKKATVISLPERSQIAEDIDETLVVQFYSR